jgi:hypothetical protein
MASSSTPGSIAAMNGADAAKRRAKKATVAATNAARRKNAVWSVEETHELVSLLNQAKIDGHWGDNGFKTIFKIFGGG